MVFSMIWRPWLLALPEDRIALNSIMAAMLAAGHWVTGPEPTNIVVFKIADPTVRTMLRARFADEPLRELDELMDDDEFVVEDAHRLECEHLLEAAGSSTARFTPMMSIAVGTEAAEQELLSLYDQHRKVGMC